MNMYDLMDQLEQRQDDRQAAQDLSAGRHVADAIKAIPQAAITPFLVAHLMSQVSALIGRAGWSHTQEAQHVMQELDDGSDLLRSEE